MEYLREVTDRFAVSLSHPDIDDFERLFAQGYSAVINLRDSDEPGQALTPDRERGVATKLGMLYSHMPVSADTLNDDVVDDFRECVASMPGKILVHSGTGNRSAALTLMHVASEKGLSGREAVDEAEKLGFHWEDPDFRAFVQNYVDNHSVDIHNV